MENLEYQEPQMDISKPELIAKLKGYISDAQKTPMSELCIAGDYKNQPELRYPQTKGESIAESITFLLAPQSWTDGSGGVLDGMLDVAGQLDKDVNQPDKWHELFELAQKI